MTTTSGSVKIFLALAMRSAKDFIKDSFLLRRVGIVEQLVPEFFEVALIVLSTSSGLCLIAMPPPSRNSIDILVTVVNQKSLFSVQNSVGFLAVSKVDFFTGTPSSRSTHIRLPTFEPSAIGADKSPTLGCL